MSFTLQEVKVREAEKHPDCGLCQSAIHDLMTPDHDASSRCESGKHSHCTCDTCY